MPIQPNYNQENQQQDEDISMRDLQKQVPKRMGADGKSAAGPRLAQQQRPQSQDMQESSEGGAVGEAGKQIAKSAFKKYLPYMVVGGSIGGAAAVTDWLYKLIV